MTFVQIIDYDTDRAEEMDAVMREALEQRQDQPGFTRLEHTRDHDNPRHFMTIVEFPSYEEAMANSGRPETHEMAQRLSAMCSRGPVYQNLDVQLTMP